MLLRILKNVVLFCALLFFLARQIYVNLLNIDRSILSAALVLSMMCIAVWLVWKRSAEPAPDFWLFDAVLWIQFVLVLPVIAIYWLAGKIDAGEAMYSVYFNCFAPFLVYVGFSLPPRRRLEYRPILISALTVFGVMLVAGVLQVLGIDYWLFSNDKWLLQATSFDLWRATGTYGSQIDFGMLSFIFFIVGFYEFVETKSVLHCLTAVLGFVGAILSFSRVFIFACVFVLLCHIAAPKTLARLVRSPRALLSIVLGVGLCVATFEQLHVFSIFMAEDTITQSSNEGRVWYLHQLPKWLIHDYPLVGSGPGTQNGPNMDTKIIGDFYWLSLFMEFGLVFGSILCCLKIAILLLVISKYLKSPETTPMGNVAFVLSISFFLTSFVDSAFAHMVTIALYYSVCGVFLNESRIDGLMHRRTRFPSSNYLPASVRT